MTFVASTRTLAATCRFVALPLRPIHNQRSLEVLDDLVDLMATCLTHPYADNHSSLVSDGKVFSTTELLRCLWQVLGNPARLVPLSTLKLVVARFGRPDVASCAGLCK